MFHRNKKEKVNGITKRLILFHTIIIIAGVSIAFTIATAHAQGNAVLIQIRTSNVTSWNANIARDHVDTPFSGLGGDPTRINGVGNQNFLAPTYSNSACDITNANGTCVRLLPNGTYYDILVGINLTSDSKPNLTANVVYGGHIINSGRVSVAGGMNQGQNGQFAVVNGERVIENATNLVELHGKIK